MASPAHNTDLPAKKVQHAMEIMRRAGLRPTQPLIGLTVLLLGYRDRHVSTEDLFLEAERKRLKASLSSVYSSPRRLHDAGLILRVPICGAVAHYDTKLEEHHYFYIEENDLLIDLPEGEDRLGRLLGPPAEYELIGTEIVMRLKRTGALALDNAGA